MRSRTRFLLGAILVTAAPCLAAAEVVTTPLEPLLGIYRFEGGAETFSRAIEFDLGVDFLEIDAITLSLSGEGKCADDACSDATRFDLRFSGLEPQPLPIWIQPIPIGPLPGPFSIDVPLLPDPTLLDGRGTVSLSLGLASRDGETPASPPGIVSSASLSFAGTPVPEPASALLAPAGLAAAAWIAVRLRSRGIAAPSLSRSSSRG